MYNIHHATALLMIRVREQELEKIRQIMEGPEDLLIWAKKINKLILEINALEDMISAKDN